MSVNLPHNANRDRNERKVSGDAWPCIVCGKPITKARQAHCAWLRIHGGGALVVTDAEAARMGEAADLGAHPVGDDCLRRHTELRPYAQRMTASS